MLFSCAGILEGWVWNLLASELKVDECLLVFWVVWWWQKSGGPSISHHSRLGLQMAKGTRTRRGCRRKDGCSAARRSRIIYQYVDFVWPVIPPPPPHREWHRSASFKPSSIIHPAALRPAARDWWAKEKRQTDEQGSRRRLRTGDREREGEANYSLSRALLRSYLSASHLTLNAAFRARVVSAVTDGNTSRKSSVVAVGPLNPLTGYKDGQSIRFQKGGRREKKKQKQKKPAFLHLTNRGHQKLLLKV